MFMESTALAVTSVMVNGLIDLVLIALLVFGVYYPRHKRSDLVVAFLGVNVGVFGVATVLVSSDVGVGLGMGLFGVLSIIRLRSSEISQREVAFYFAALAVGLICGVAASPVIAAGLSALIVGVLAIADALNSKSRQQEVVVDTAIANRDELIERVARLTGADVINVEVIRLDTVNDTTLVNAQIRQSP